MIYNLSDKAELQKAWVRFKALLFDGKVIELKEKKNRRSVPQNAYLHVLITLFSIEFGYTLEESKTLLKRNCSFMVYEKNGDKFLRSTSKMDSKELTEFIDWIRNYAGQQGLYLPTSEEYLIGQYEIDKSIAQHKEFL